MQDPQQGAHDVAAMTFDGMADRLANAYRAAQQNQELGTEERAGALWALGEAARALGVFDQVRARLTPAAAAPVPVVQRNSGLTGAGAWQVPRAQEPMMERVPLS